MGTKKSELLEMSEVIFKIFNINLHTHLIVFCAANVSKTQRKTTLETLCVLKLIVAVVLLLLLLLNNKLLLLFFFL